MNQARYDFANCEVTTPKRKTGALILYRIARAAKERGIWLLMGTGEKSANAWGFYTSPRMGFEAPIPAKTPARPAHLAACTMLSQLLATPDGRDFWKANGDTVKDLKFDLSDNSYSWQTLKTYLA